MQHVKRAHWFWSGTAPRHEVVPQVRIVEHQRLRLRVVTRWTAFDEVGGDGERGARETDERDVQLAREDPHGLEHMGGVGLGLERA